MKDTISLKLYVTLIFLSLTTLLVLGYAVLSAHYYRLGMDSITAFTMDQTARDYLESTPLPQRNSQDSYRGYILAKRWQDMPAGIQRQLPNSPKVPDKLTIVDNSGFWRPPDEITFALYYHQGPESIYIVKQDTRQHASPIIGKNAGESLRNLTLITLAAALVVTLVTWLILHQVSRPVSALGTWARSLDAKKLQQPPPDFQYPELNQLAELIRSSLHSVEQGLDREHRFLKHASHELRTPISVIRNNIELMHKLQERPTPDRGPRQRQVLDRIDRASLNMKHMTETLLWLSRDELGDLPVAPVQLETLLSELTENLSYLVRGKKVEIQLTTSTCTLEINETIASIVLTNLIRNALQHTSEGVVYIEQQNNQINIINPQSNSAATGDDLGFGLGLRLTEQLVAKLGWPYINLQDDSRNTVRLTMTGQQ